MHCQRARDLFPELLDPRTPAGAQPEVRAHLAGCPDCQREFAALTQTAAALDRMPVPAPSARLRQNFHAMLEEEKLAAAPRAAVRARRPRALPWAWLLAPLAGCALLALGFMLGRHAANEASDPMRQELVALREQMNQQREQFEKMTSVVAYSILQQQQSPANERLQDVLAKARSPQADDKVLEDLILAVTLDPSANVRLRAIEALYPHAERAVVRAGILAALPRERDPLVQLELIDFVAAAQVRSATPALEKLSADESTNAAVRDAARFVLAQL